ncbi:unnamed protein product [Symbiodinium natans]|uniref:Uncharacterized protein n=1 Tax=Symbiodinium natans TaxID=878477 RepID=A0A812PX57_9DINO|nr:unnamed protein product [Symbiodinium natans]
MVKRKASEAMDSFEAPPAAKPTSPRALVAFLDLRLSDCNEELLELQAASRRLHEAYAPARRQMYLLMSALLRGDAAVAAQTLKSLEQVALPSDVVGDLWSNAEVRARFSESNELGGFLEGQAMLYAELAPDRTVNL